MGVLKYYILRQEYSAEDASYLTRCHLRYPKGVWDDLEQEKRDELIQRKLWKAENMAIFMREYKQDKGVARGNKGRKAASNRGDEDKQDGEERIRRRRGGGR